MTPRTRTPVPLAAAAATVLAASALLAGATAAAGRPSAATREPAWLVAKQRALANFTPPPPAAVALTPKGAGTVTGTADEAYGVRAQVTVGPTRSTSCTIVGELLVPDGATAADPQPAVMTTNGFGGSWTSSTSLGPAEMAASKGYVALTYSGLGFGGSGCQIELDSPTWDGLAASELISWFGEQPEVQKDGPDDPRIGMTGGSYGGGVQFSTAEIDPRLDAIVPVITWNDLAYSLAPDNGTNATGAPPLARATTEPGVLKWEWATLFFADGTATPLEHPTQATPSTCPDFAPTVCMAYLTSISLGYPDRATVTLLRHDSMVDFWQRLHLPVLLAQGEKDSLFTIEEAVANERELSADGDPVTLVLQSWGHSDLTPQPGEFTFTPPFDAYENVLVGDFFAKWLRGESVSTGAPVQYFRDWVPYTGNAAPAYGSASSWPVGRATDLYLSEGASGAGALVGSASAVAGGSQTFVNPPGGIGSSYSETSYAQGTPPLSTVPPTDAPGTDATWESAPLATPLDVVGVPSVSVRISSTVPAGLSPATDPVVVAKLEAVAPTGAVTLVDRLVSPVRVASTTSPVTIDLPGVVHRYPAGDRLELVLAAGDLAYYGNRAPDTDTVTVNAAHPSVLSLPVVSPSAEVTSPPPTGD